MGYIVKVGDTLSSIADAHNITIDQLVSWNGLIQVGQTLVIKPPIGIPPVTPIGGTVKFVELGPSGTAAANKVLQTALNREFGNVVVDGDYGPQTMEAYTRWQNSMGFFDDAADGLPGEQSIKGLAAKYGFSVDFSPVVTPPPPPVDSSGEPAHNYSRTTYGGRTVNQRTKEMLNRAAAIYGGSFPITQGSYNSGVGASAGTHDGGGVVDIGLQSNSAVKALRQAGFAAWQRTPSEGFAYHIHACAIGDREMSSSAENQVESYFDGRNGLANNGPDSAPASVGRPWPQWANKYANGASGSTGGNTSVRSVTSQQGAVNGLGYTPKLLVDGIFGPQTEAGVVWLQDKIGVMADGDWGPVTEAAYVKYTTPSPSTVMRLATVEDTRIARPVPGHPVTYAFGIKNASYQAGYHTGEDYAADAGTPVVAVLDGTIAWADRNGGSYGTWLGLRADNGRDYVYCHLASIAPSVKAGTWVEAGQIIGYVGTTGNSTGPHLHFEDRPAGGGYGTGRKPTW